MSRSEPSAGRRVSERLVGRDAELRRLVAAVRNTPAIILVEGEAGIGKSRLVAELPAAVPDRRHLRGGCEPIQEPFPLAPVLDALGSVTGPLPELNPVVGALGPALPELADRLPPAPPLLGDLRAERHRLLRAAAAFLDRLGPAVLVLEDVHWADESTTEFIGYLAGRMPSGLAVVLTARPGSALRPALARVTPVRIEVPPLAPADVRELAAYLLGAEVPDGFADSLVELTAGIPFVIEEVVTQGYALDRTPAATPAEIPDALDLLPVPPALHDVLVPRLEALDEQTREILDAAAVLGLVPDERLLAAVLDQDPGTIARALSRALRAGLLHDGTTLGSSAEQCRFRHALARQAVYQAVPAPTRRWLHGRVAEVLDRGPEPRPVAAIAHHYQLAGRAEDFVRSAEAAADLAVSRGDDASAARYLLRAVETPGRTGLTGPDRVRLAGKLARAAVHGLAQAEAVPVLTGLLDDPNLPPGARGELRFLLGRLYRQQGEALRGYRELERATADLADDPRQLALALAILSVPEIVTGRHVDEHRARAADAAKAAERCTDPAVGTAVGIATASLRLELGEPDAVPEIDRLLAGPGLAGVPRERARACLNWAQGALHVGDLALAERMLIEGRTVAARAEYLRVNSVLDLIAASVDLAAGRWAGLEDRVRRLVSEPTGYAAADLDTEYLLGAVLAVAGDPAEAEHRLRTLLATADEAGALWPLVPARVSLSRLLLATDRPAEAAEAARAGLGVLRAKGNWVWAAETVLCLLEALNPPDPTVRHTAGEAAGEAADQAPGEPTALSADQTPAHAHPPAETIHRTAGHPPGQTPGRPTSQAAGQTAGLVGGEAVELVDELDTGLAGRVAPAARAYLTQCQAMLAYPDPIAERLLEQAHETFRRLGLRYQAARAAERRGWSAWTGRGAAQPLHDALPSYQSLGAELDLARTLRAMRRAGVPVPYPWRGGRRSYGSDLSPREREVARLAALGRTNQEIAERLYVSRRTVESHVASALRKLGGQSRRDLARLLPDH